MPSEDNASDEILGAELTSLVARFNRWATRHGEWAVPAAQARLLAQVDELGSARIGDLAHADHCSQPAMTTQVRRLEEGGLLARCADPADGRAVLVSLTARGRRVLADVRQARAAAVAPIVARLDATERRRLRAAIATLSELLNAASDEPRDPRTGETK